MKNRQKGKLKKRKREKGNRLTIVRFNPAKTTMTTINDERMPENR